MWFRLGDFAHPLLITHHELKRSPNLSAVCQAPTVEVKMTWLHELRRILTDQQKLLRGLQTNLLTLKC